MLIRASCWLVDLLVAGWWLVWIAIGLFVGLDCRLVGLVVGWCMVSVLRFGGSYGFGFAVNSVVLV